MAAIISPHYGPRLTAVAVSRADRLGRLRIDRFRRRGQIGAVWSLPLRPAGATSVLVAHSFRERLGGRRRIHSRQRRGFRRLGDSAIRAAARGTAVWPEE